jgi:hypothetical protein
MTTPILGSIVKPFPRVVRVGKNVLLAAYVYLVGGTHRFDRTDIAIPFKSVRAKALILATMLGSALTPSFLMP